MHLLISGIPASGRSNLLQVAGTKKMVPPPRCGGRRHPRPARTGDRVGCMLANKWRIRYHVCMDEGRKRVLGIMAAILASLHMRTADDLFGGPQGSPSTDRLIQASKHSVGGKNYAKE